MIKIKRIYDEYKKEDGYRILADRLWPRGISKEDARIDLWIKEISPSTELRKWFSHDPSRWSEFSSRYEKELHNHKTEIAKLIELEKKNNIITLLYSAKDTEHNNAVVIYKILKRHSDLV